MKKIILQTFKYLIITMVIILLLEILIRISDKNCYSVIPIYFEKEHSSLIKNDTFCVKFTGHPKSIYKTNEFGMRISDIKNKKINQNNLLIGDSQAMGYGINFENHFLNKYLKNKKYGKLEILAAPHNDLRSINSFVKINNFNFDEYRKVFIMFNLGVDLDRFVFGWQNNWNISHNYIEIKLFKYLRLYPYLKNIYLKFKKYHFTYRPSINPYFDYLTDQEINYLVGEVIEQYLIFINNNKITNYEFILIAPAWYIDKNQIEKYKIFYTNKQFQDLNENYLYYSDTMKTHIEFFRKKLESKKIKNIIIENLIFNGEDLFQKNNYHLNSRGHEKIFNSLP